MVICGVPDGPRPNMSLHQRALSLTLMINRSFCTLTVIWLAAEGGSVVTSGPLVSWTRVTTAEPEISMRLNGVSGCDSVTASSLRSGVSASAYPVRHAAMTTETRITRGRERRRMAFSGVGLTVG